MTKVIVKQIRTTTATFILLKATQKRVELNMTVMPYKIRDVKTDTQIIRLHDALNKLNEWLTMHVAKL